MLFEFLAGAALALLIHEYVNYWTGRQKPDALVEGYTHAVFLRDKRAFLADERKHSLKKRDHVIKRGLNLWEAERLQETINKAVATAEKPRYA